MGTWQGAASSMGTWQGAASSMGTWQGAASSMGTWQGAASSMGTWQGGIPYTTNENVGRKDSRKTGEEVSHYNQEVSAVIGRSQRKGCGGWWEEVMRRRGGEGTGGRGGDEMRRDVGVPNTNNTDLRRQTHSPIIILCIHCLTTGSD